MRETEDVSNATLVKVLAAFWSALVFLFMIRTVTESWESRLASLGRRVPEALLGAALCWLMCLVLRRAAPRRTTPRLLWLLGLSLPIGCLFSVVNAWALYVSAPVTKEGCVYGQPCSRAFVTDLAVEYSVNFAILFLAWGAIYLGMRSSAQALAAERRAGAARDGARVAELRALRYQVDPHFLFNCLNSLGTLVDRGDSTAARGMIGEMSSFLRYGLTIDPLADVELDDEIEMQRRYLEIERLRFAHRLVIEIHIEPFVCHARIPSLLLQPLVENAIKHGVASTSAPVTVTIRAKTVAAGRVSVFVENDAPASIAGLPTGLGIGLTNVAARLHARFEDEATLAVGPRVGGGYQARIDMPLIRP